MWEMIDSDVSWQHCGRPAYWEGEDVYCSKCQEQLPIDALDDREVDKYLGKDGA